MGFVKGSIIFVLFLVLLAAVAYGAYTYGQISLRNTLFEVEVPIHQNFSFAIDQEISFPINQSFDINELVPVNVLVPIDTFIKVPMNIEGKIVETNVPLKTQIPINTSITITKTIYVSKNIKIPIKKDVLVPIDGTFTTQIPVPSWMKK